MFKFLSTFFRNTNKSLDPQPAEAPPLDIRTEMAPDLAVAGKGEMRGLVMFYVSVGQMPPFCVNQYLAKMKQTYEKGFDNLPAGYFLLFVPVRPPQQTGIIIHKF